MTDTKATHTPDLNYKTDSLPCPNYIHACTAPTCVPGSIFGDLLDAAKDMLQAHDVKMGRSAVKLRVELLRAAIARAKAEGGA